MADFILNAPKGANKKKFIVGRGSSSGNGTTAGKGNKGQQSRSGGKTYVGFEGGQMPLYRRIAHRGFSNYPFKKEFSIINVCILNEVFESGETVDKDSLVSKGLIDSAKVAVKILGNGELTKKLTVNVDKVSASAKTKIEAAGGSVVSSTEAK
ncbi:50S ribosomal protein L15 [Treponema saccharophilum]|jgi:large subunit ribosomal protein L15|uniref:Large ribosomal subunit protein uL15 n=1 Tax=Treponema saccharophilum DSM 2985 TaxID=907348 RepID=H7ENC5_9SPIR|nr:50S ribosomal protein L15 [Treponema saccharophilum]EIC00853.1 LSU ribosomal protein L15P [Treponema saccharophilum DSM 2985]BDC95227.1 50S ribosomal protein L15 [Treponema saccharophilum]